MFISWKANNEKGNITPYIARKYLELIVKQTHFNKTDDAK